MEDTASRWESPRKWFAYLVGVVFFHRRRRRRRRRRWQRRTGRRRRRRKRRERQKGKRPSRNVTLPNRSTGMVLRTKAPADSSSLSLSLSLSLVSSIFRSSSPIYFPLLLPPAAEWKKEKKTSHHNSNGLSARRAKGDTSTPCQRVRHHRVPHSSKRRANAERTSPPGSGARSKRNPFRDNRPRNIPAETLSRHTHTMSVAALPLRYGMPWRRLSTAVSDGVVVRFGRP